MEETQVNLYLGQKVRSKKTGFPGVGYIVGFSLPSFWMMVRKANVEDFSTWNNLYPEWEQKPLAHVFYQEPRKTVTFEEFKSGNTVYKDEVLEDMYNKLELAQSIMYPYDDLEVFDENIWSRQ